NRLTDCRFVDCDLPLACFRGSTLRLVTFEGCRAKQANFSGIHPIDDVMFTDCKLNYSSFFDSTIRQIAFRDCNLHGADLRFIECASRPSFIGCNLWGVSVTLGCQFFGGIFDERSADLFTAMVARVHPQESKAVVLERTAGTSMAVVRRLMDNPEAV